MTRITRIRTNFEQAQKDAKGQIYFLCVEGHDGQAFSFRAGGLGSSG